MKLGRKGIAFITVFIMLFGGLGTLPAVASGSGQITINKVDSSDSAIKVQGAVFEIEIQKSGLFGIKYWDHYADVTTNSGGVAVCSGLSDGKYRVHETDSPNEYVLDSSRTEVTVSGGNTVTLNRTNVHKGKIKIVKHDANYPSVLLQGAKFSVFKGSIFNKVADLTTGADGSAITSWLEPGSDYFAVETDAPDYYEGFGTTISDIRVTSNSTTTVDFNDDPKLAMVSMVKMVDGGDIDGYGGDKTFTVTMVNNSTGQTFTFTKTGEGHNTIEHIPFGVYTLQEINIPDGFAFDKFSSLTGDITGNQITIDNHAKTFTCDNDAAATMRIIKDDGAGHALSGATFAVYRGTKDCHDNWTWSQVSLGYTPTTDASGACVVKNLPLGRYKVVETGVPMGYEGPAGEVIHDLSGINQQVAYSFSDAQKFGSIQVTKEVTGRISDDGVHSFTLRLSGPTDNPNVPSADHDYAISDLAPTAISGLAYGTYDVSEIDIPFGYSASYGLSQSSFKIDDENRDSVAITVTNEKLYGSFTVAKAVDNDAGDETAFDFTLVYPDGSSAPVSVPGNSSLTLDDMPYGTYTLTEAAHAGYELLSIEGGSGLFDGAASSHTFTLDQDNLDFTVTAHNLRLGKMELTKKSAYDGSLLNGAAFRVTSKADPSFSFNMTSGSSGAGKALSGWLRPGEYEVKEITAPDGYAIDEAGARTITVLPGQTENGEGTVFTDSPGTLTVQKYSSYTHEGIPDVHFQLLGAPPSGPDDNSSVLDEQVTNGAGIAVFHNVLIGHSYWVREIQQAEGYDIDKALVISVTGDEDPEEPGAEFTDNPLGRVSVVKVDRGDGTTMLDGAVFGIFDNADCAGDPITTVTSSAAGPVESDGIPFSSESSTFWVREITPPAGYILDGTPQSVTFTELNRVEPLPLTFADFRNVGSVVVRKTDALNPDKTLEGAEFTLYADQEMHTLAAGPVTTGEDGIARFDGLEPGTYWVMETKAPKDYDIMTAPVDVTVIGGVTEPDPLVITDQYNPPKDYQTGTMNWNYVIFGGMIVLAGLLLLVFTRRRKAGAK
jgi:LPXTG-motif cell wall-anchored protein